MFKLAAIAWMLFPFVYSVQRKFDLDLNDAPSNLEMLMRNDHLWNLLIHHAHSPMLSIFYYFIGKFTGDTVSLYYISNSLIITYGALVFSLVIYRFSKKIIPSFFILVFFMGNPFLLFGPILHNFFSFSIFCTFLLAGTFIKTNVVKDLCYLVGAGLAYLGHPSYLPLVFLMLPIPVCLYLWRKYGIQVGRVRIFLLYGLLLSLSIGVFWGITNGEFSRADQVFRQEFDSRHSLFVKSDLKNFEAAESVSWIRVYGNANTIISALRTNAVFFGKTICRNTASIFKHLLSFVRALHYLVFSPAFGLVLMGAGGVFFIRRCSIRLPQLKRSDILVFYPLLFLFMSEMLCAAIFGAWHRGLIASYAIILALCSLLFANFFCCLNNPFRGWEIFFFFLCFLVVRPEIFQLRYNELYNMLEEGYTIRLNPKNRSIVQILRDLSKTHSIKILTSNRFQHLEGYMGKEVPVISAQRFYKYHWDLKSVAKDVREANIIAVNSKNEALLELVGRSMPKNDPSYRTVKGFFWNEDMLVHQSIYQDFERLRLIYRDRYPEVN